MKIKFEDSVYNILKWMCLVVLPAIGVFYCGIAEVWQLGYVAQVTGTITAIETLLGALLGVSCYNYNKENKETSVEDANEM